MCVGIGVGSVGCWTTHRSFSLSHLGLLQTCFAGIQVQAKVLQKATFFLKYIHKTIVRELCLTVSKYNHSGCAAIAQFIGCDRRWNNNADLWWPGKHFTGQRIYSIKAFRCGCIWYNFTYCRYCFLTISINFTFLKLFLFSKVYLYYYIHSLMWNLHNLSNIHRLSCFYWTGDYCCTIAKWLI